MEIKGLPLWNGEWRVANEKSLPSIFKTCLFYLLGECFLFSGFLIIGALATRH